MGIVSTPENYKKMRKEGSNEPRARRTRHQKHDEELGHNIITLGKLTNKLMSWDHPERHAWEQRYYWNRGTFEHQRELWRRLRRERRRREKAALKAKKMFALASATCLAALSDTAEKAAMVAQLTKCFDAIIDVSVRLLREMAEGPIVVWSLFGRGLLRPGCANGDYAERKKDRTQNKLT
jgi:hypothetical protein